VHEINTIITIVNRKLKMGRVSARREREERARARARARARERERKREKSVPNSIFYAYTENNKTDVL
jgi:hypothetical protein